MSTPAAWKGVDGAGQVACDRVHSILKELRHKYRLERAEIVTAVTDQVSDVRVELEATQQTTRELTHHIDRVRRHLVAMETSADQSAGDATASLSAANAKLDAIEEQMRRAAEDTHLVKAALLNDRIRREERQRQQAAADAETDVRLRHVEESNAALRAELHVVKSVNVEASQSVADLLHECKFDAPTTHAAAELGSLRDDVLNDLQRVRAQNAELRQRVESVVSFCEQQETSRSRNVEELERTLRAVQASDSPRGVSSLVIDTAHASGTRAAVQEGGRQHEGLVHTPRQTVPTPGSLRDRVAAFYGRYNPSKLSDLDRIMGEYAGAEEELLSALEVHYGAFGYFSCH